MADWIDQARERLLQGPAALVTILATEGSAPRGPGARMVVTATGLTGTIGGGALEYQATEQARAILAHPPGSWRVQDYPLGPLLGQCCGGRGRVLGERLGGGPGGGGPVEVTLSERVERKVLTEESRDSLSLLPGEGRGPGQDEVLDPGLGSHQSSTLMGSLRRGTLGARGPLPTNGARFVEAIETETLRLFLF